METPKRIVIVGSSGSGKTWLGKRLAAKHKLSYIELDDLAWDKGWVLADARVASRRVKQAMKQAKDRWVICGNYSYLQPVYLEKADYVVWLDLPLVQSLWSMIKRAFGDVVTQRPICNGNRQTWAQFILNRDALVWWMIGTHKERKAKNLALMTNKPKAKWIRVTSRKQASALVG